MIMRFLRQLGIYCRRHTYIVLSLILLLGIVLRVTWIIGNPYLERDSYLYLDAALRMVAAPEEAMEIRGDHAALILLMAMGEKSGIGAANTGRALNFLCGCLLPLAGFGVAYLLFKRKNYALIAALLFACNGELIRSSGSILRDIPYCLLLLLTLGGLLTVIRKPRSLIGWCVALLAGNGMVLFRLEGFELFPFVLLWCFVPLLRRGGRRGRSIGWRFAVFSLFAGGVILLFAVELALARSCGISVSLHQWNEFNELYWRVCQSLPVRF